MNIVKQFIKYVSQNIMGMLGISCYIVVDTFFISKAAGADGITVLNLALPVYGVIFAIGQMIGVGAATRYTIIKASGRPEANYYFSNGLFWIGVLSLPFIAAGIFFPGEVLRIMGGDSGIVSLGTPYARLFLLFAPFFMSNYLVNAFVRNDGAPTVAMIGTLAGSLFNIIFDYIFMFTMHMGLKGAALATVMSPLFSLLVCSSHFFSKSNNIRFVFKLPRIKLLVESCQLGVSAFVGEMSSSVTMAVFNFLILGLVGNIGVAAYGVIANLALIAVAIYNGIAFGMQPILSDSYGKGDKESVNKAFKLGLVTAFLFSLVIVGVVFLFTDPLVAIFNSEGSEQLRKHAFIGMRIYFAGYFFAGINIIITGFFGATNKPKEAFIASLLRGFVAITVCSVILASLFQMTGVWMSFAAAEGITLLVSIILAKSKKG